MPQTDSPYTSNTPNAPDPAAQLQSDVRSGEKAVGAAAASGGMFRLAAAGIIGGLIGGVLLNATAEFFRVVEPPELAGTQGIYTPEQRDQVRVLQRGVDYRNAPLAIGLLGMSVAAALGAAAAGAGCKGKIALKAGAIGGASGFAAGAIGGVMAVFIRELLSHWNLQGESGEQNPLLVQLHTMAVHLPSWLAIAAAAAIACCSGSADRRGRIGAVFGVAMAGVLMGMLIYPTTASLIFAGEHSDLVIPTGSANRIFWTTTHALLMALLIARQPPLVRPSKDLPTASDEPLTGGEAGA